MHFHQVYFFISQNYQNCLWIIFPTVQYSVCWNLKWLIIWICVSNYFQLYVNRYKFGVDIFTLVQKYLFAWIFLSLCLISFFFLLCHLPVCLETFTWTLITWFSAKNTNPTSEVVWMVCSYLMTPVSGEAFICA